MGKGITQIPQEAFFGCNSLSKVIIKGNVECIGYGAFWGSGLKSFIVPECVLSIESAAFGLCNSLTSITFGSNVESISDRVLSHCESLKSVTVENANCKIFDYNETLGPPETTIIYGYKGSTAEKYAKKYGYTFKAFGEPESIFTTTKVPVTPVVNKPSLGDSNGDGVINAIDASEILAIYSRTATNKTKPTSDELAYCDVNKDGAVNAVDASYVLSFYAYNATSKTKISFTDYMKKK